MSQYRLKMSNKRFLAIMLPIMAFVLALAIAVTIVAEYFSMSLDTYIGRGNRVVSNPTNTETWDLDYYTQKYETAQGENGKEGSLDGAEKISKAITDEGTVLFKNSGALPLAKGTKVTPFGARYRWPIYGGTGSGKVSTSDERVWTPQEGLEKHFRILLLNRQQKFNKM